VHEPILKASGVYSFGLKHKDRVDGNEKEQPGALRMLITSARDISSQGGQTRRSNREDQTADRERLAYSSLQSNTS